MVIRRDPRHMLRPEPVSRPVVGFCRATTAHAAG
jgi:hypothetical protein